MTPLARALPILLLASCNGAGRADSHADDAGATQTKEAAAPDTGEPSSSSTCGPRGGACTPNVSARCQYCDSAGDPWHCTCAATGKWECTLGDGQCGATCGDRRCLPGELCQELEEGAGAPRPGPPGPPQLQYRCWSLPRTCTGGRPTCACAAESIPRCSRADVCMCSDLGGDRTVRCTCQNP
jgi:hypothetical protein